MLVPVAIFLLAVLVASRRVKGPLWAMCLAWLFCIAPMATGAVSYRYLTDAHYAYSFQLILFTGAFALGAGLYEAARRRPAAGAPPAPRPGPADFSRAFAEVLPVARICWAVAMFATALNYIDFTLLGGAGLDDLVALRDAYTNKTSASVYAQIGSILTWACLFCYMFALFFRAELGTRRFALFLLPIAGFFLLSVFSAGRQAAFQIMVVTLLLVIVVRAVRGPPPPRARRRLLTPERLGVAGVIAAMVGYMGYVAVARNDQGISDDKTAVLLTAFEFTFSDGIARFLASLSAGLRGAIVEGVTYFSASPALFETFLTIRWPSHYLGAMSFPFLFRQVEGFTGLSAQVGLLDKMNRIDLAGGLGSGWATSMSSYIIDFGYVGTLVFLFVMGGYSAYAWRKAVGFASFYAVVIGVLVLLNALYMPLTPGVSDTNLLLLWLFCVFMHRRLYRHVLPLRRAPAVAAE